MKSALVLIVITLATPVWGQHDAHDQAGGAAPSVASQPLLNQVLRMADALDFLGSSLPEADKKKLRDLQHHMPGEHIVASVQQILDPYCLATVHINPEARVKVTRGPAPAKLVRNGWVSYLVKVHNEAGVTAPLEVESPQSEPPLFPSAYQPVVAESRKLTPGQVASRFLEAHLYRKPPMLEKLSGLALEYGILQLYSKDEGQREAEIGFNIGHGTQDIGFRNSMAVLFTILPSVKVIFNVLDADGSPAMASFVITDGIERILDDATDAVLNTGFRLTAAQRTYDDITLRKTGYRIPPSLKGIYPLPARRVAAQDEYPDFFFQPQVYRADGEHVYLPPGRYSVTYTRGPEYVTQNTVLTVPEGVDSITQTFRLKRWINMAELGWYSADHHVHAAGCSHYESPEEGVRPEDMWRQVRGEDLNVSAVLGWGPGWYYQKNFFSGNISPLSTTSNVMRYDVEVSGFPSSHAGHLVLLRLKEDDYPGTTRIEEWPSWTLPVLEWAKRQGALTGYAHSGWGLQPVRRVNTFPNDVLPRMDGIGANEYIVTVTKNVVDFYSAGNTPAPWELNMWYHTLNVGFRPRLSGETDFPCIFDERVGMARSYFKGTGSLDYDDFIEALTHGRNYVSEGHAHMIDFTVNNVEMGTQQSEVQLSRPGTVVINAKVLANLPVDQDAEGASIARRPLHMQPYWHIERARIGQSRKVSVELIVNGEKVQEKEIDADASWHEVSFRYAMRTSGWIALRIHPAAHTNPVFVLVNDKPVRVRKSALWCARAVDQCWKMKKENIRADERAEAEKAYLEAKRFYDRVAREARE